METIKRANYNPGVISASRVHSSRIRDGSFLNSLLIRISAKSTDVRLGCRFRLPAWWCPERIIELFYPWPEVKVLLDVIVSKYLRRKWKTNPEGRC